VMAVKTGQGTTNKFRSFKSIHRFCYLIQVLKEKDFLYILIMTQYSLGNKDMGFGVSHLVLNLHLLTSM
jgi:hypothetical protein